MARPQQPVPLYRGAHPARPVLDMAISHAVLRQAARDGTAAVRIYRPGATVAFGRLDKLRPGFPGALAAARRHGFAPVLRSSGGHAVAYDHRSLIVEEIEAGHDIVARLQARFGEGTARIVAALTAAGLAPRLGELPGEYCAGAHSVNLAGRVKVAGTAQRAIRGAALFSAFILVGGGPEIRSVLTDVYTALAIDWDPRTAGAVDDVAPAAGIATIEDALVAGYRASRDLREGQELSRATIDLARTLEELHRLVLS